jgi:hypothetical protein
MLTDLLVQHQSELILELVAFNHKAYETIQDLNARLRSVEGTDTSESDQEQLGEMMLESLVQPTHGYRGASNARSRSPSEEGRDYRQRDSFDGPKKNNGRVRASLQISIPGKMCVPSSTVLPTPMTLSTVSSACSPLESHVTFKVSRISRAQNELKLTRSYRLPRLRECRRHH